MTPEIEQMLRNQLAIMELLKSLDWKLTMQTTNAERAETWGHSINDPIKETEKLLRGY